MKIVLIGLHFAEIVGRLALALSKGHDVRVFVARHAAEREWTPTLRRELEAAVPLVYLPHPHRARALWHGWRLARAVAKVAPDVVHVQEAAGWTIYAFWLFLRNKPHNSYPADARRTNRERPANIEPLGGGSAFMAGTSAAMTTRGALVPDSAMAPALILTVHDPQPHSGDVRARARTRWADARVRRGADAVIVHGEALVRQMEATEPDLRGRVYAVPHGALGESERASPPPGQGRFLMFGRLQAYKGLGVLLEAAEILTAQNRRFELLIAGTGDDLEIHRARIARLATVRLDERYVAAEEVAALFAACDAVATPYLDATQSGVGALAMAAGRAVIATDVGALGEMVRDGENGLIVPAGDSARLAAAMARILDEPGLAARLGRGARETAEEDLSWERVARRTMQVFEAARGAPRRLQGAPPFHPGPDLD